MDKHFLYMYSDVLLLLYGGTIRRPVSKGDGRVGHGIQMRGVGRGCTSLEGKGGNPVFWDTRIREPLRGEETVIRSRLAGEGLTGGC